LRKTEEIATPYDEYNVAMLISSADGNLHENV
jgi:hypothetical protein